MRLRVYRSSAILMTWTCSRRWPTEQARPGWTPSPRVSAPPANSSPRCRITSPPFPPSAGAAGGRARRGEAGRPASHLRAARATASPRWTNGCPGTGATGPATSTPCTPPGVHLRGDEMTGRKDN